MISRRIKMRNILKTHGSILSFLLFLFVSLSPNSFASNAEKEKMFAELDKIGRAYTKQSTLPAPTSVEIIITMLQQAGNVPPILELLKFSNDVKGLVSTALKVPDAVIQYVFGRQNGKSPEESFNDLWDYFQDTQFKKLIRQPSDKKAFIAYAETVYLAKRYVTDESLRLELNKWSKGSEKTSPTGQLAKPQDQTSQPGRLPQAGYRDGVLLKGSRPEVYVIRGGQKCWIPDPATFKAKGYDWNKIVVIPDEELKRIPEGPDVRR